MFMEALLVRNDLWQYVNCMNVKPEVRIGDEASANATKIWEQEDAKARSDIILSISASKLKQVKGCTTSRQVWLKLESVYQSKGPARKAALLKQLVTLRMQNDSDVHEHIRQFFDTVDKICDIGVEVDQDLLSTLLLISLPNEFDNFRCAIESRDTLPSLETLRVKVTEEADARRDIARDSVSNAMLAGKRNRKPQKKPRNPNGSSSSDGSFKYRCHKCRVVGHKAADCKNTKMDRRTGQNATDTTMLTSQAYLTETVGTSKWCLDSGATSHFCHEMHNFETDMRARDDKLCLANKESTRIKGEGTARLNTTVNGEDRLIHLENSLLVPDLRMNLLSVGRITERGFNVIFHQKEAKVVDQMGNVKLVANKVDGLYVVEESAYEVVVAEETIANRTVRPELDWHRRFGHLNVRSLQEAVRRGRVNGVKMRGPIQGCCEICVEGKMTRNPFPARSDRTTEPMDLAHTDLCGPMRVTSHGGAKYILQFVDDCSRWGQVYFLKSKSDVFQALKDYVNMFEKQTNRRIKCIQSDNGKEFVNAAVDAFLRERGIVRRLTVPYSPQQNGVAERRNRTIVEMARCILLQSDLRPQFWAEAVNTANHIRNRCPSRSLNGTTPLEALSGRIPDVSYFREFGNRVLVLNNGPGPGKFDSRCVPGIFVGYSDNSKGYRVWISNKKGIVISRDIKFLPNKERSKSTHEDFRPRAPMNNNSENKNSCSIRDYTDIELRPSDIVIDRPDDVAHEHLFTVPDDYEGSAENGTENLPLETPNDPTIGAPENEVRRRTRGRPRLVRSGERGRPRREFHYRPVGAESSEVQFAEISEVPMKTAMSSPETSLWWSAMIEEIRSIVRNDTWDLIDRPDNQLFIGSRMVLRNKMTPDGSIERRKARLVAQGFRQKPGVHFNETFAPVARLGSIRLMVSLAAHYRMKIHHLDVTTAYLNGHLKENVLMRPPEELGRLLKGVIDSEKDDQVLEKAKKMLRGFNGGNKVCRLKKSLYGLRQAGRNWYLTFDEFLRKCGAVATNADTCLYRIGKGESILLIAVYVDDVLIASKDEAKIRRVCDFISRHFVAKNLGEVNRCLGIEFHREKDTISLNQKGYIYDMLRRFRMDDCNAVSTPIDPSMKLKRRSSEPLEDESKVPYRELVGCLTYLASSTRPDIAFAASYLGQFNNCFDGSHWRAAKRVLRYLKGTMDLALVYRPDAKPLTGFLFLLSGCLVTWDSKKQKTVALSTCEDEYVALTEGVKEGIFMQCFLRELGFEKLAGVVMLGDNLGAIKLGENQVFHQRSKHIDIRYHFVRDVLRRGQLRIQHVSTVNMAADVLTKGLPRKKHADCLRMAGLRPILRS